MAFFYTLIFCLVVCFVLFFCPWALQAVWKNWVGWDSKSEAGEVPGTSTSTSEALWGCWDGIFSPESTHLSYSRSPWKPLRGHNCLRGKLSRSSCGIRWAAFHRPSASVVGWQFVFDFNKGPLHTDAAGSGKPRPCCCAKKSLSPDKAEVGTADNGPLRLSRNHYTTEEEAATVLNPISGADGLSGTGCLSLNQQLRITSPY